jgi:DNA (cytosine-5)-methyltransferase 1
MAYTKLNTFHLFAGAGGGILADLLLGHNPIGACEIEPYPRDVLLARQRDGILPSFPIWDDVCTLDGRAWRGLVDIVCGGFPCQDLAICNPKAEGISGKRSGLWSEMFRFICECEPENVFVENSPMLVSRGLGRVLNDLSSIGYICQYTVMGGHETGSCTDGKRFWLYATKADGERRAANEVQTIKSRPSTSSKRQFSRAISATWDEATDSRMRGDTDAMARSMERLKAIGNGQDPVLAATAFNILSGGLL